MHLRLFGFCKEPPRYCVIDYCTFPVFGLVTGNMHLYRTEIAFGSTAILTGIRQMTRHSLINGRPPRTGVYRIGDLDVEHVLCNDTRKLFSDDGDL